MTPQLAQTCLELSKTFQCHLHNMFVDVSVIKRGGKILGVKLLLETPQVDRPTLQIRAKYALAHDCSRFAAIDILKVWYDLVLQNCQVGFIPMVFYCRAAVKHMTRALYSKH